MGYLLIIQKLGGPKFYVLVIMAFLAALLDGIGITMLLPFLEAAQLGGDSDQDGFFIRAMHSLGLNPSFVNVLILMALIFILKGAFKLIEGIANARIVADLFTNWRIDLLNMYGTIKYGSFMQKNSGHFTNVINAQVNTSGQFVAMFASFISRVLTMLVYLAFVAVLSPRFTLYAAMSGLLIAVALRGLMARTKKVSREYAFENSVLNAFLIQVFQAYKYLKGTDRFGTLQEQANASIHRLRIQRLKAGYYNAVIRAVQEPLAILTMLFVLYVYVYVQGFPLAPILVTLLMFYRALNTLILVQSEWQVLLNISGDLDAVVEEIAFVREHQDPGPEKGVDPGANQDIVFEDVSFSYGESLVLKSINLRIPCRSTTALVGPSGSGKTTLSDLIIGLLKPTHGFIKYGDIALEHIPQAVWGSKIGYVTQEPVLFNDSIKNNISLWDCDRPEPDILDAVVEASRKANADGFIEAMPDAWETKVGERGLRLSGGQKQRLSIARELYKHPELLIMDEATSALDSESEALIQQSLMDLHGQMTVVVIAHRLATTKGADWVVVMDKGEVVEKGSYEALARSETSLFRTMLEAQGINPE